MSSLEPVRPKSIAPVRYGLFLPTIVANPAARPDARLSLWDGDDDHWHSTRIALRSLPGNLEASAALHRFVQLVLKANSTIPR